MQKWILIGLLFLSGSLFAQERRLVLWNKNDINIQPWKKVSINVAEKIHYSPKNNAVEVSYGELSVKHQLKNWLSYGTGIRIAYLNVLQGEWLNENRPMAFVTISKNINNFNMAFGNRMEYRTYKTIDNYFRYKQDFKITFPALTSSGLRFYLAEESFIKLNGGGLHLARLYSGLTAFEKQRIKMNVYYSLEKAKVTATWYTADIIGLNLQFSI